MFDEDEFQAGKRQNDYVYIKETDRERIRLKRKKKIAFEDNDDKSKFWLHRERRWGI